MVRMEGLRPHPGVVQGSQGEVLPQAPTPMCHCGAKALARLPWKGLCSDTHQEPGAHHAPELLQCHGNNRKYFLHPLPLKKSTKFAFK